MIPVTLQPDADAAPGIAQKQRWALKRLLHINDALLTVHDGPLVEKLRAIDKADSYDAALADKKVGDLFRRGVLSFGAPA